MKKSGKCPKCESTNIFADAIPLDRASHYAAAGNASVGYFGNPRAIVFKEVRSSPVRAWVCAECGFIEYYAMKPEKLVVKKTKKKS